MAFLIEPTKYRYISIVPTASEYNFILGYNASYSYIFQDFTYKFNNLAATWKYDTRMTSSASQILLHDAYQEIIGMGEKALPLIFNELNKESNQWFWALKSITGYDPIKPAQMGDISQMKKAWLEWGSSQGYV